MERALGARLLNRTTRSLALTEEGERYFEQARRLVGEIAEAEATLRKGEQQFTGWLRVAASVGFGRLKLLPQVKSDLRLNDGFIDLVEQDIDVAVRIGELADSTLGAKRIGTRRRDALALPPRPGEARAGCARAPHHERHRRAATVTAELEPEPRGLHAWLTTALTLRSIGCSAFSSVAPVTESAAGEHRNSSRWPDPRRLQPR